MVRVRVRQDYRWHRVRVDGREFCKSEWINLSGEELSEEILGSTLLEVEEPRDAEGAGPSGSEPPAEVPAGLRSDTRDAAHPSGGG